MRRILKTVKGILAAAALTVVLMALMTALVMYRDLGTGALKWINQGVKMVSIALGVFLAVGRGGEKGMVTGMITGIVYVLIGYGMYCMIDGSGASAAQMAIEEAAGAVVGGISGIVLANMKPPRKAAGR